MPVTGTYKGRRGGVDHYDFVDQLGATRSEKWKNQLAVDPLVFMAQRETDLNDELALEEVAAAMKLAEAGQNPDKEPPDHQPQADFDRRLISALMQNTSIETTIAALPFWTAHQASARSGNNNPQRAATLGVPVAEYAEADSRFGTAQGIAGGVNTWKSETWDGVRSEAWK